MVPMSLSPRPETLTMMMAPSASVGGDLGQRRDRVGALERAQDALRPRQALEPRQRLGVGDRQVASRGRSPSGTRARGRRPGSRGRPRSSAPRRSARRRRTARRTARRAARRRRPARQRRRVAAGVDARRRPPRRRRAPPAASGTNAWNRPDRVRAAAHARDQRVGQAALRRPGSASRASRPITAWRSRTSVGYGCGPAAEPIT